MLKTTSGTTNGPRQVAFTESQVFVDPLNIVTSMGLVRDSPNLGAISLSHSYGFSNLVLPLLLHGIPLTLVPNQLPETIKQAASAGRNWTLPAVPALWHVWNETSSIPRNIRLAISAGSPLPLPLEQAVFVRHGLKIHNFLGSSECGGIAYDASNTPRTDASCVGSALHGVGLHLGDNGCLVVSGTQVGQTYWPEPSDTLGGGIFHSSDLVEFREGVVFVRGRFGDLINMAGRKLLPETVERAILLHPSVLECLVLGLPSADTARGDVVAAVVATREATSVEDLRRFLQDYLPDWQIPREWRVVNSLVASSRGKLSRVEWKHKFNQP